MFAQYFEYYAIILRGPFFCGHSVYWYMIVVDRLMQSNPAAVPPTEELRQRALQRFRNAIQLLDNPAELRARIAAIRQTADFDADIFRVTLTHTHTRSCDDLHCVSKKVSTFKLSVTLSNLNRFSKVLNRWKAREICYKILRRYSPHLTHVATLPWEITNSNFLQIFNRYGRKCQQTAFLSPLTLLFTDKF